jgi:hypothetical protein
MKRPGAYARSLRTPGLFDYFNEVLTEVKVELSPVPIPFTVAMIAIAIPTAMRPYSMAVAPDSSLKNVESIAFMWCCLAWTSTGTDFQSRQYFYGRKPKVV